MLHIEISSANIPRDTIRKCIDINLVGDIEDVKNREHAYVEKMNLDHLFRNELYDLRIQYNLQGKRPVEARRLNYYELSREIVANLVTPSRKKMKIFVAPYTRCRA